MRSNVYGTTVVVTMLLGATPAAAAEQMGNQMFTLIEADQLEYRLRDGKDLFAWDAHASIGTDENKFVLKTEGEYERDASRFDRAEVQLLYRRLVSDFFDAQIGVRHDFRPNPARTYAVVGLAGLAPQWLETDANLFISEKGIPSARINAEHDLLLTQRLILQSSAEVNFQAAGDRAAGLGSGFSSVELGLRMRYEIAREVAPYIGVHWERKFGRTADFAKDEGEAIDSLFFVTGLRLFF